MHKHFYTHLTALIVACFLFCNTGKAQYVTIPDTTFVAWLQSNGFAGCMNGNQLDTTCSAVVNATSMSCSAVPIRDLTGIQYFKGLTTLDCSNDSLYYMPALPNSLTDFNCQYNNLDSLPVFSLLFSRLISLSCSNNNLSSLPSLPGTLESIVCNSNPLNSLPGLPAGLESLECESDNLNSLPALPTSLQYLYCDGNPLNTLPELPNYLTWLSCNSDNLTSLPALPSLTVLSCGDNQLTDLPVLPLSLTDLECEENQLTALPVLPPLLGSLWCSNNQLYTLPALPASLSLYLWCYQNNLTSLPELPASLTNLVCDQNNLTSLPALPASLTWLICDNNELTGLPELPSTLTAFSCRYNQLSSLPALPATMTALECNNNLLTTIPPLPDSTFTFDCHSNPNLTCLPELKRVVYLRFDSTAITCLPNYGNVTSSNPALDTVPLCGIFNPNGYQVFWNISGQCFYDANNDCMFDSTDVGTNYVKTQLYSGGILVQQTFSGGEGFFSFDSVNYGNYTVTVDTSNLPFTINCPDSDYYSVTLSAADSLSYNNNFAFKCRTIGFDIGVQSILNYGGNPRPNTAFTLGTIAGDMSQLYGAHCASGISGQVQMVYTGQVSYLGPAPGALTPATISGDTLTWAIADYGIISDYTSFNMLFKIDSLATPGTSLCFTVTVTPITGDYNPSNNTLSYCFPIVNSLDPNEKEVYPSDSVGAGQWLTYTIRFQNTGSAPAVNIIVQDTLDPNLDPSTFQLLAFSAPNLTQIFGNVVVFNFPNINLPDSATSDSLSTGYVQYRIMTRSNIAPGTQINNTADIYFDANPAVVTNTVSDTIAAGPCEVNYDTISATICQGTSYPVDSQSYSLAGSYNDTLTNVSGCDSIVTLNLTVLPLSFTSDTQTICSGQSYNGYDSTGTYIDTLTGSNGCDSIVTLNLTVLPLSYTNDTEIICQGQSYGGYSSSGVYADTLNGSNGCDSIYTLYLTVLPVTASTLNVSICSGQSYNGYDTSGTYFDTLTNVSGCNSFVTTNLTVLPLSYSNDTPVICQGQNYNGYDSTGIYVDTLTNVSGCDSIVTINLTVLPLSYTNDTEIICQGQSYGGFSSTGVYADTLTGSNGCDSIYTLYLTVLPVLDSTLYVSICTGQSYDGYDSTGTYIDTLTGSNGCDSIVTLNLAVNNVLTDTVAVSICPGTSYNFNGNQLDSSGTFIDTLTSSGGCDSIVTLNLTVLPLSYSSDTQTICQGQSYSGHNATGVYADTLTGSSGCDSIVTLNLIVLPVFDSSYSVSICAGQSYNGHSTTGVYADTLTGSNGCDSIITLNLTVNNVITTNLPSATTCEGIPYTFNGNPLTATGTYADTLTSSAGCDSIVVLNLTVNPSYTDSSTHTICAGQTYDGDSLSGIYADTLTSVNGCDSIIILNLIISPNPYPPFIMQSNDTLISSEVAPGYQWYLNGTLLAGDTSVEIVALQNGNYQVEITGPNNCSTISESYLYPPTGIQSVNNGLDVKLYPNPNNGSFVVEFSDNAVKEVCITDVLGQVIVPDRKVTLKTEFDLSALESGVYFLKISDALHSNQFVFRQVVVQH